MILQPKNETFEHLDQRSREIMLKTVAPGPAADQRILNAFGSGRSPD